MNNVLFEKKYQTTLHYSCMVRFGSVGCDLCSIAVHVDTSFHMWYKDMFTLIPFDFTYIYIYIDRSWKIAKWNETVSVFNFEKCETFDFVCLYCTLDYAICLLW